MLKISIEWTGYIAQPKRAMNRAKKIAWLAVGEHHFRKNLRKHFTESGGREYGYAPRTKGYKARKLRQRRHRKPLVWSGETRHRALNLKNIKATSKGVTLRIDAPTLNRRHPKSQVNMRAEMETISRGEIREIEGILQREIVAALRSDKSKRVRRLALIA